MRSALLASSLLGALQAFNGPDLPGNWGDGGSLAMNEFNNGIKLDSMMQQVVTDLNAFENKLRQMNNSRTANPEAKDKVQAQTDQLHRFVDLKKLVSWLQPIDKRISRYCFYGCWCLPEGAHEFVSGTGKPVDLVDKACYQLWTCYECARDAFNNNGYVCNPNTRKYSRNFFYDVNNPNDYAARGITCLNRFDTPNTGQTQRINCARAICECDKWFSMRLYKYHTFWSKTRHRIWSRNLATPFIVADDCHFCQGAQCGGGETDHSTMCCGSFEDGTRRPYRDHEGLLDCCHQKQSTGGLPWYGQMYNTLTSCCQDGVVPPSNICNPPGSGSGIVSSTCNAQVFDVIFVIDESGSVGQTNFGRNIVFVNDLLTDFDMPNTGDGVRVAAVRFNTGASVVFDFEGHKSIAINNFNNINYNGGGTSINHALQITADNLGNGGLSFRTGVKTVAIVMTDGVSQDGINPGANNLRAAKGAGEADVLVLGVGIGGGVNTAQVNLIATDPDADNAIFATGYDALDAVKTQIGLATCS